MLHALTSHLSLMARMGATALCTTLIASSTSGCNGTNRNDRTLGSSDSPVVLRPSDGMKLPPTRAFLLWKDGKIPAERKVTGYQVCSTTEGIGTIVDESQCPNGFIALNDGAFLDGLSPKATYHWKVRAQFDDGTHSLYSALQTFSTQCSSEEFRRGKCKED